MDSFTSSLGNEEETQKTHSNGRLVVDGENNDWEGCEPMSELPSRRRRRVFFGQLIKFFLRNM